MPLSAGTRFEPYEILAAVRPRMHGDIAVSGLVSTLIFIVFSFVPTAEIRNVWLFEAKIMGGTIAVIAAARLFYWHRTTRGIASR